MIMRMPKPSVSAETPSAQSAQETNHHCLEATGTWYYDHDTTEYPPSIYAHLLAQAHQEVCIWDPYVEDRHFPLFKLIPSGVDVRCLTSFGYNGRINFDETRVGKLVQAVDAERKIWVPWLTIKFYNCFYDDCGKNAFHDRYLFIDEKVYSVGSSLAHHLTRRGSTAIHQIQHPDACLLLREMFEKYWHHNYTQQVFPVKGVHYEM